MIFDLLTPPQGPRGRGKKKFDVARPIHVSNAHTKFGRIASIGLGGDSITERRAITISPLLFQKSVGITRAGLTLPLAIVAICYSGDKIFKYCTCPAGRVTYNFHSSCKRMHMSLKYV